MKRTFTIAALALSALLLMASAASAQVAPGTYAAVFDDTQAPSGTHVANNSADPSCTVAEETFDVDCSAFVLGGVGNMNATSTLEAEYTATIDCNNPGNNRNNPIESHEASFSDTDSDRVTP